MTQSNMYRNMKFLILLLPILAVVAVSGCTSGGGIGTGNGIVIEVFEPTLSSVYSDQEVGLILKIENRGEARAEDIYAEIFGININDWNADEQKNLDDLLGVDSLNNVLGGTRQVQWTDMRAPQLTEGQIFTYRPKVRVSYDYATSAIKPITIVDKDEIIRLIQEGESIPSGITTYTSGPLSVAITTGQYVIGDFQSDYTFNLHIRITDLWWGSNGRVVYDDYGGYGDSDDLYPFEIMIDLPDDLDFRSYTPGCSSGWDDMSLATDGTAEITCELEVSDAPDIMVDDLIRVDLRYRFAVDASTTIKVTGTEQL